MTVNPVAPVPLEIEQKIADFAASGMPRQKLIWQMRLEGLTIIDCMRLMHSICGLSRKDAKFVVHESDAWASMRGEYDAFHDRVEEAARQSGLLEVTPSELQRAS